MNGLFSKSFAPQHDAKGRTSSMLGRRNFWLATPFASASIPMAALGHPSSSCSFGSGRKWCLWWKALVLVGGWKLTATWRLGERNKIGDDQNQLDPQSQHVSQKHAQQRHAW